MNSDVIGTHVTGVETPCKTVFRSSERNKQDLSLCVETLFVVPCFNNKCLGHGYILINWLIVVLSRKRDRSRWREIVVSIVSTQRRQCLKNQAETMGQAPNRAQTRRLLANNSRSNNETGAETETRAAGTDLWENART